MNPQNSTLRYIRLTDPKDIDSYLLREQQPLPNTPKITINSRNHQIISVFVQKLTPNFYDSEWKAASQDGLYQLLQTAIIANMSLKKKFGCFRINQNHVRQGPNNSLRVWIHEDPVLNYRQYSLPIQKASESLMVKGLYTLFKPIIPQLESLSPSETLQSFLSNVRTLKAPSLSCSKNMSADISNFSQSRKAIKSFYEIPSNKVITNKITQLNSSLQGSPSKGDKGDYKNYNSPNYSRSYQKNKDAMSFESPSSSFSKKNTSIANELKKRLVNFTYSSPLSMKTSMMHCQRQAQHFIQPSLQRSAHPIGESYKTAQSQSIIAQQYRQDMEQKQKVFGPSKFPHSTESTFVTLKETKSFADMHFEQFQHNIIQQQTNQNRQKSSRQSKSSRIQQVLSKSGSHRQIKSKKSGQNVSVKKSMLGNSNIQDQFQNLFFMDKEQQGKNQEEFFQRQMQFEDILFS